MSKIESDHKAPKNKVKVFVGFEKRQELLSDLKWRNDYCVNYIELVTSNLLDADQIVMPGEPGYHDLMDMENMRIHLSAMARATYEELTKSFAEAERSGRMMAVISAARMHSRNASPYSSLRTQIANAKAAAGGAPCSF